MKTDIPHKKQVDKKHYEFAHYMTKKRWFSLWHQLDEIQRLKPAKVLEVGPGPGLFKTVAAVFGITVETLDFDPDLKPDYVGSAIAMPFRDETYDVVCAFQVLEHLPYEVSLQAFAEMVRVCRSHVVISLPDARIAYRYQFYLPRVGTYDFLIHRPQVKARPHAPELEHYWEINKLNYPVSRIVKDFTKHIRLVNTYRVPEHPYHRFFIFAH